MSSFSRKVTEPVPNSGASERTFQVLVHFAGCGGKPADIVFALDASGSIWGPDFSHQKTFVSDVIRVFNVSQEVTRVALLTFGDEPLDWFLVRLDCV